MAKFIERPETDDEYHKRVQEEFDRAQFQGNAGPYAKFPERSTRFDIKEDK